MQTEYEVKILEINIEEIKKQLEKIGAIKIAEGNMRRFVYEINLDRENRLGKWIRLRDDSEKSTLTIKEILYKGIDGTKETEIEVNNFEKTNQLIRLMGFKPHAYQENKRISYKGGNIDFEIDSYPKIPTSLEIEGKSVEDVEKAIISLGFKREDATSIGVTDVYDKYELDINQFNELKFE